MTSNSFRILIIDDNHEIHMDFIKILTTTESSKEQLKKIEKKLFDDESPIIKFPKFNIDAASQGQEGIQFVRKAINDNKPYALAFVDIRMPPGWDGIETIKHIWEIDPDIQIVICTAYSDYSWQETVVNLGEKDNLLILKKPFDYDVVRQLSVALTKKWQLTNERRGHTKELESKVEEKTKSVELQEDKIHFQETHDLLTKLPNRELLAFFCGQEMMRAKHEKSKLAIMLIGLDRFKLINDSFSHAIGDEILLKIAHRIEQHFSIRGMVARMAGDKFVLVITKFQSLSMLKKIGMNLFNVIKQPFKIVDQNIIISASIGISIYPDDCKNMDELIRNADMAMYYAKELGGDQLKFYTKELNKESLKKLALVSDLHRAIINQEFYLCFQPQYDLNKFKLTSVEALVRWKHPSKGIILPIDFIPLAEETGHISAITEWVLQVACEQNKSWQDMHLPHLKMAINISMQEFKRSDLIELIKSILNDTRLEPKYLELELTENIIFNDIATFKKISQLKDLGISIAIDDFGTGYSNLSYLKKFPVDRIKIDKSFIKNIDVNHNDQVIIKSIITMAKNLKIEVIAEGVETLSQLNFLKSLKCNGGQGFYLSQPLEAKELESLLKNPNQNLFV